MGNAISNSCWASIRRLATGLLVAHFAWSQTGPLEYVEQMPVYSGGAQALHQYLATSLRYPPLALKQGLSGEVVVQFTVDTQGRVLDPVVVRTSNVLFNEEARRLVWQMPWWQPGRDHGQPVHVRCTLPIKFTWQR